MNEGTISLRLLLLPNGNLISSRHVVDTEDDSERMFTFVPISLLLVAIATTHLKAQRT